MFATKPSRGVEQLPPLSENAQIAADESYVYAVEQDLFLHLLTDEHLLYHFNVAHQEFARIPYADKKLYTSHLPILEIPPVTVNDTWTVHQRVASVLESACRWLSAEELKQYEEAVVKGQQRKMPEKTDAKELKLECPVIASDHGEDCAELRRTVSRYHSYNGRRLDEKYESDDISLELFDVSETDIDKTESMLRSGTIAVDEQTIRWLMAHIENMDQKVDVQGYILSTGTMPDTRCRRLSSPLPAVLCIDEYLPEGEVCYVSEGSEPSSSIGEYAKAAVNNIPQNNSSHFIEAAESIEAYIEKAAYLTDDLLQKPHQTYSFDFPLAPMEDILPLFTPTLLEHEADEPILQTTEDENMAFRDFIAESVCSSASDIKQHCGDIQEMVHADDLVIANSQCSDVQDRFHDVTADILLGMEDDDIAKQAKLTVPDIDSRKYLPEWYGMDSNPTRVLQLMMETDKESFGCEEWEAPESCLLEESVDEIVAKMTDVKDREWEASNKNMERVASWIETDGPEAHGYMDSLVSALEIVFGKRREEEEQIELLQFTHVRKVTKVTKETKAETPNHVCQYQQSPPEPSPQSPSLSRLPNIRGIINDSWGSLMDQFRKRKLTTKPGEEINGNSDLVSEVARITAPELLIGSRAFESAHVAAQKNYDNDGKSTVGPLDIEEEDNNISDADLDVVVSDNLPKVILSTAVPRVIRTRVLKLLPGLDFVERDYNQYSQTTCDIDTDDEADIVTSPSSGIIMTTMVSLRQMDGQRRPLFQNRLSRTAKKYEILHVLVYRNGPKISPTSKTDRSLDISPSDALAFSQLLGFTKTLPCDMHVVYISGGEYAVAQCAAKLIIQNTTDKYTLSESYLVDEATKEELFLRQAGLNVYDAQIVMGVFKRSLIAHTGTDAVQSLIGMLIDNEEQLLAEVVGSQRALEAAKKLLTVDIQ